LGTLGLSLVAPTVLACSVPLDVALSRLRDAGYFPVADEVPGQGPEPRRTGPRQERTPARSRARPARQVRDGGALYAGGLAVGGLDVGGLDVGDLAKRLLAAAPSAGPSAVPPQTPGGLGRLRALAPQLPLGQLALLSDVLDGGGRLAVTYLSASGALTHRVISDPELIGSTIHAWCELRQDDRVFTVSRLLSLAPP
jgi:hypothetical protein